MRRRSVGTLVIVDDERTPQGLVADRDLAFRVVSVLRRSSSLVAA